ncbi:hypothetical protein JRO89_XS01G0248500 [Xanthoceras sorbifolium]|uniref:Peptidase A1 domain-containing protein n=1 Tax=Xanthoceras sorbifolium TaxID=99658 RepID=A0ABQ8ILX0_9ROSI|nr:hypothetical protein JRO89_XS01G0248500 [Xanthoceras sorbifolium]
MAPCNFQLAYFFFSVTSLLLLSTVIQADTNIGFSVDLIQRDSPLSPFYNPSETYIDRLHNAFLRSILRINHFKTSSSASTKALQSPMVPSGGEYFMEISIGGIKVLGVADTGSDLNWIQCKPCKKCFKQKPQIFDPTNSSTYKLLPCESPYCTALEKDKRCDVMGNVCGYKYSYGDGSFTEGNIGSENFTIASSTGSLVSFSEIIFGCGHNNVGVFDEVGSGIIGIGGGPLSLISQLSSSIRGKFSHCLVPTSSNVTSKITFGTSNLVSGHNVVSTPLVDKEPKTYYYVTLEAISVGKKRLAYTSSAPNITQKGNMIIDTGTTYTFLDPEFYEKLAEALEKAIGSKRVRHPSGLPSVCFQVASDHSDLPIITVHFTGADVKLPPVSSYITLQNDMVCLTMIAFDDIATFGNLSQMNLYVGYDLENRKVSFMPTDCTMHSKNA